MELWADITAQNACLFVIDCQEKLMAKMWRSSELVDKARMLIKGFSLLNVPIIYSEQYPKGLGSTVEPLKACLDGDAFEKTSFSCIQDTRIAQHIRKTNTDIWVLVGIEAHVCLLQTAKDLVRLGKKVVVAVDATSSRSQNDYVTALSELQEIKVRLTSSETLLFELVQDAKHPLFKQISALVR